MKLSSIAAIVLIMCGIMSESHAACGASEPAKLSALDTVRDNPQLVTFYMLVRKAGLTEKLKSGSSSTIFAPTDSAFRQLPRETMDRLEKDKDGLRRMLLSHIAEGRSFRTNLETQRTMLSMNGDLIYLKGKGDSLSANGVRLSNSSVPASNAVIHLVDSVFPITQPVSVSNSR